MPQLQNLVLTNRATPTPADTTFVPRDIVNGVGTVINQVDGVPVGERRFTVSMRKSGTRYRGRLSLVLPVVQSMTVDGISKPTVVRNAFANVEFVFDETSTQQERNDLVGMLASALASNKVLVNDTIVKLEGVY